MANPQKENGFIAIASEIAECLALYRITGVEYQILWVVWRKTWGWGKKEDGISFTQFEKLTGHKRSNVIRAVASLVSKMILGIRTDTTPNTYYFNKDYDTWVLSTKKVKASIKGDTSKKKRSSIISDTKKVSKVIPEGSIISDTHNRYIQKKKDTPLPKAKGSIISDTPPKPTKKEGQAKRFLDETPQSLEEYILNMRASPQRYIRLLAEFAEEIEPTFKTKGQWNVWSSRHMQAAVKLASFSDDQIDKAMNLMEKDIFHPQDNPRGWRRDWDLNTVIGYMDKLKN